MLESGIKYESLYEMQQKEVAHKREKQTKLIKKRSMLSVMTHDSSSAVARTRPQDIARPMSMLERHDAVTRLEREKRDFAHAQIERDRLARFAENAEDERKRSLHEAMMRERMPAMQMDARLEREAQARRRGAISLSGDALSTVGSRHGTRSTSSATSQHPGPRSSSSIGFHPSQSQELLGLQQRNRMVQGQPQSPRHVGSMKPSRPVVMNQGGSISSHSLHRSITETVTLQQQQSKSRQHHVCSTRTPVACNRKVNDARGASFTDRTRWPYNQTYLPPGQLQYAHFDNTPCTHNNDITGTPVHDLIHTPELSPEYLARPRTAPLERRSRPARWNNPPGGECLLAQRKMTLEKRAEVRSASSMAF
jgi:hypothetical protein